MARCYYLDYESKGFLSSYGSDEYVCKLCGKHFATNDPQEVHLQCRLRRGVSEVPGVPGSAVNRIMGMAPGERWLPRGVFHYMGCRAATLQSRLRRASPL